MNNFKNIKKKDEAEHLSKLKEEIDKRIDELNKLEKKAKREIGDNKGFLLGQQEHLALITDKTKV